MSCTCANAREVCPRCRYTIKEVRKYCPEARVRGELCDGSHLKDVPTSLCPGCKGLGDEHTATRSQRVGCSALDSVQSFKKYFQRPGQGSRAGARAVEVGGQSQGRDRGELLAIRYDDTRAAGPVMGAPSPQDRVSATGSKTFSWFPPARFKHADDAEQMQWLAATSVQAMPADEHLPTRPSPPPTPCGHGRASRETMWPDVRSISPLPSLHLPPPVDSPREASSKLSDASSVYSQDL